ncbi:extracellular solute-binding protein [Paenibacillus ginsengarvi]|uniref:Extracellular solute-binding protein n=1 Tax=Paenibacillus ginsengarvi TaxID=400777 RepID=A0A3B0CK86_9BACL|nr:extracellular solute-binding protein [Paenibacillus ginsengarvi]RKN84944.1 extracellular solute-binding protein [Paenibacillus ginsengarvi]
MDPKHSRATFRSRLDELVSTLRDDILSGKRPAGEFLPSEKRFAEQYNLSNQSVRKGLDILAAEKLIERIPRVGNRVLGLPEHNRVTVKLGYHLSIMAEAKLEQLLAQFEQQHPHIRVQLVPMPVTDFHVLQPYMDNGLVDVITLSHNNFREFADRDHLETLEPLPSNDDTYPFLAKPFIVRKKLLVQPFLFSPVILTYNRDHFREQNIPEPDSSWTWQDLFAAAAKLTIPDERIGFYYPFLSPNRWPLLFLQHDSKFRRDGDGRARLDDSVLEAFRFGKELRKQFPFLSMTSSYGETEKLFVQGKVSMVINSYFHLNLFPQGQLDYDIASVPHFGDPRTLLLCVGLAVNRYSPVKEAALRLVQFLSSPQTQLAIRQKTLSLPSSRSAAEWNGEDMRARPSRFTLFREIIPSYRLFTDLDVTEMELKAIAHEAKLFWFELQTEEELRAALGRLLSRSDIPAIGE